VELVLGILDATRTSRADSRSTGCTAASSSGVKPKASKCDPRLRSRIRKYSKKPVGVLECDPRLRDQNLPWQVQEILNESRRDSKWNRIRKYSKKPAGVLE